MAILTRWQLESPTNGWAEFTDIKDDWLAAVTYAMQLDLAFPVPGLPWSDVYVNDLSVQIDHIDATAFGDLNKTYLPTRRTAVISFTSDSP